MTLTVEDGTGLADADSYVTVQEADDYADIFHSDTTWDTLTLVEKEARLKQATRFLDTMVSWASTIKKPTQALAWPRHEFNDREGRVVSEDSVPELIKNAQIDLAIESLTNTLTLEYDKLIREDFGDTSDSYAAPVARGGSSVVRDLVKNFAFMRYGRNRTTVATVFRA